MRVAVTVETIRHQQHVLMRQRRYSLSHVNVQTMEVRIVAHVEMDNLEKNCCFDVCTRSLTFFKQLVLSERVSSLFIDTSMRFSDGIEQKKLNGSVVSAFRAATRFFYCSSVTVLT